MFRFLPIVLLDFQLPLLTALFTVEVLKPYYNAEYGSDVRMGCCFPVDSKLNLRNLSVSWTRKLPQTQEAKEVYKLHMGQEDLTFQDTGYRGRATLLHEQLKRGRSVLHIANLKLTDAGVYFCAIDYGGADYKYITLEVEAPYKRISIEEIRDDEDVVLTCQSQGYPLAEVTWHSVKNLNVSILANTTYELTNDGLFNITSILRFKPGINENYSCEFWNKELNEKTSAHILVFPLDPTDVSAIGENYHISYILPICGLVLFSLIAVIIIVLRRKSFTNPCIQQGRDTDLHTEEIIPVNIDG